MFDYGAYKLSAEAMMMCSVVAHGEKPRFLVTVSVHAFGHRCRCPAVEKRGALLV
jgi:hypothetical protein